MKYDSQKDRMLATMLKGDTLRSTKLLKEQVSAGVHAKALAQFDLASSQILAARSMQG